VSGDTRTTRKVDDEAIGAASAASADGGELVLAAVVYDDEAVTALIAEVQEEYVIRYGGPDATPVDADHFAPPSGAFLIARSGDEVIGCGGLRRHDEATAEIKRMYVRAAHRRNGHGRRLLRALEHHARSMGYTRTILETGTAQPEAMALYAEEGYQAVSPYGYYRCSADSRHFAKDLSQRPTA
jgi:GNAT superfamily N-acetyltransferase